MLLAASIERIVEMEGPIHHEVLLDRLKILHGVARAGANIHSNVARALAIAKTAQGVCSGDDVFFQIRGRDLESFRLPTESVKRAIEHISSTEIEFAILYLVEDQFGVVEESIPVSTARLFGCERLKSEGFEAIRRIVDSLASRGLLHRNGIQVHLP